MFEYFSKVDADQYKFYRIPKDLVINPEYTISFESKILYGILLDRLELSEKSRWEDENGYMYIYFPLQQVMEQIQCKRDKAIKLMNELQSLGLIEKKQQGQNKPNRIYVKKFVASSLNDDKENSTLNPFFTETTANQYCFYKIPKELLSNDCFKSMPFESKILYSFLLERVGWSEQSRWTDKDGQIYIYFSLESVMEFMHCQREKAVKLMDTLVKFNFITKKRQGQGKPNRIYVKNFMSFINIESQVLENRTSENRKSENRTSENRKSENRTSGSRKIELLEVGKSNSIKTEYIKTELSSSIKEEKIEENQNLSELYSVESIKQQLDYNHLEKDCSNTVPKSYLDMIVDVIYNTLNANNSSTFKTNGNTVSYEQMRNHLLELSYDEIEYVVQSVLDSESNIKNPQKYLLTALYNAKSSLDFTITNDLKKQGII